MNITTIARIVFGLTLFVMMTAPFAVPNLVTKRMSASEPHGSPTLGGDDCLPKDPPPPVVKIKVRVPLCSEPGRNIEYRICVENCSTSEAHHVVVKNALPSNAKFVKADPEPSKQGPELQWNLGTVGGGAVREIILVLQPTNTDDVKNCARVQFEHGQCVVTRLSALPPGSRPPIITTVPDVPDPKKGDPKKDPTKPDPVRPEDQPVFDLTVHGPQQQYTNLPAKYEITLTNKGKTKATDTRVTVRLSDKLKAVRVSAGGVDLKNLVEWKLGTLEPGATKRLELVVRANEKGEHCVHVVAEGDLGIKKDVETCTKFAGNSAMTVEMIARVNPVFVGAKTSFPISIQNQGTEPLTNIRLRVFMPNALKLDRTTPPMVEKQEEVPGGQWIEFKVLPKIDGGTIAKYEVFADAVVAGFTRFHIEVRADQLENGPVIEEELVTIVDDREKLKIKELSRTK